MKMAIVKLSALGDIIHSMVVLQYIKKHNPKITIDWFVEENFADILRHNPDISNIYSLQLKNNKKNLFIEFKKLKKIAKKNNYDLILDLQGLIKSALVSRILGRNIAGFDKNSLRESVAAYLYKTSYSIPYQENVILRNLLLCSKALEFKVPNLMKKKSFLFSKTKSNIYPSLLIFVGSSWKSKVYPKESFLQVVKSLNVKTYVAWGNEKERDDAEFIAKNSDAILLPKVTLDELKSIIQNSKLIIGADSGPTHMAWALNIPSITIFGPTPSYRNTYQTDINKIVDCGKKIDAKSLNRNDFCIKDIPIQVIIKNAKELLEC